MASPCRNPLPLFATIMDMDPYKLLTVQVSTHKSDSFPTKDQFNCGLKKQTISCQTVFMMQKSF